MASASVGIDPRSLALVRIAAGLCVVIDVVLRVCGDARLLTDAFSKRGGLLTRGLASGQFSLYFAGGTLYFAASTLLLWVAPLALVHICCALCLALGVGRHWSGPATWLLHTSIVVRALHTSNGGDFVLLQLLLWVCLLPTAHDRLSLSASEKLTAPWFVGKKTTNWATTGLCLHVPMVFLHTGWHKIIAGGAEWHLYQWRPRYLQWPSPIAPAPASVSTTAAAAAAASASASPSTATVDAVALSLCIDRWLQLPGLLLRQVVLRWPMLTETLTAATILLECIGPLLFLLVPILLVTARAGPRGGAEWAERWRTCLACTLGVFMAGLASVFSLGMFAPAMLTGLLPHVSGETWDLVMRYVKQQCPPRCVALGSTLRRGLVEGALELGLLRRGVNGGGRRDKAVSNDTSPSAIRSGDASWRSSTDDAGDDVLQSTTCGETETQTRCTGFLYSTGDPATAAAAAAAAGIADPTATTTADRTAPPPNLVRSLPLLVRWSMQAVFSVIPAALFLLLLLLHADALFPAGVGTTRRVAVDLAKEHVVYVMQLQQSWPMFGAKIGTYGGWVEVEGHLANGSRVDVLRSLKRKIHTLPVTLDLNDHQPGDLYLHGSHRWHMVWSAMRDTDQHNFPLGELLCREWSLWLNESLALESGAVGGGGGKSEGGGGVGSGGGGGAMQERLVRMVVHDRQTHVQSIAHATASCQHDIVSYAWFNYTCGVG